MGGWIAGFILWIVLSILAGVGAKNKGRSFAGFFFLSLLLSPLVGLIAMAVAKKREPEPAATAELAQAPAAPTPAGKEIPCPNCGLPKISGSMCQHCGSWQG